MLSVGELHETQAIKRTSKEVVEEPSIYTKEQEEELLAYEEGTRKEAVEDALILQYTPFRQLAFLARLFFSRKFIVHRVGGLAYLLQYAAAFYYYFADYKSFLNGNLIWTLPMTGVFQSISAIYTFTFLPKKIKDQGYFSDKYTMNYQFIVENSFYSLILLWQWLYYNDNFYPVIKDMAVPEMIFVFFPYVLRQNWPKTKFRDSLESTKARTPENQFFYKIAINVTKVFYIWAKHYIGYFLNYARFLNRVSPQQTYHIYLMEISSAFATTIAVFLHTLKFRKMIGPRTSFMIYFFSYMSTFISYYFIMDIFVVNADLSLICLGGLLINFKSLNWQIAYQVVVFGLLVGARFDALPEVVKSIMPLPVGMGSA